MDFSKEKYKNIHQDLIERCRKQDQTAQFEIYKLYYKSMYNATLRIVNIPAEAEDIMQEAFLTAFTKIETYRGEVSFGAWLKKIVVNKSIDFKRSHKLIFEELDDRIREEEVENEMFIDNADSVSIQLNRIKQAITQLADGYRIVLSLYLIEGYDHEEIGQILNISESSSRSQLTRAKKKLIELLNNN